MRMIVVIGVVLAVGWKIAPRHHTSLQIWGHRWVDHEPRDSRDVVREAHFNVRTYEGEPYRGTFEVGSFWQNQTEWFEWELNSDQLHLLYLQTGRHEDVHVTLTECHEHGYDYCLDLGSQHYVSKKDWDDDDERLGRAGRQR